MDKLIEFALVYSPFFWLAMGIGLAFVEAVTVDLVAIWFSLGAIVAVVPAYFGVGFRTQVLIFFVSSGMFLLFTRPMVKQKLMVKNTPTNADRSIGQIGRVLVEINNNQDSGRVHLDGLDWTARSEDGEIIEEGEQVLVKNISGVKLIVERLH